MASVLTSKRVIKNIVAEAEKLDILDQQKLLVQIRLINYLKASKKPIAKYNKTKIKPATMTQIDQWKHDSRVKK